MTLQKFAELSDTVAALRSSGEQILKAACAEFLTLVPEAESLNFKLSVPYFNDGDVCLPSASGIDVEFIEDAQKTLGTESYYEFRKSENPRAQAILALMKQMDTVLGNVGILCNIIDYNQQVNVTRDSFEITDYSEDY